MRLILSILILFLFSRCDKKNYTCNCAGERVEKRNYADTEVIYGTERKAERVCGRKGGPSGQQSEPCTLE